MSRRQILLAKIDTAMFEDHEAQLEVRRAKRNRKKTFAKYLKAHKELADFDKMKENQDEQKTT